MLSDVTKAPLAPGQLEGVTVEVNERPVFVVPPERLRPAPPVEDPDPDPKADADALFALTNWPVRLLEGLFYFVLLALVTGLCCALIYCAVGDPH